MFDLDGLKKEIYPFLYKLKRVI